MHAGRTQVDSTCGRKRARRVHVNPWCGSQLPSCYLTSFSNFRTRCPRGRGEGSEMVLARLMVVRLVAMSVMHVLLMPVAVVYVGVGVVVRLSPPGSWSSSCRSMAW